jgi:hypothetical protein
MPSGGPVEPAAPGRTKASSSVARNEALQDPVCHCEATFERPTPLESCEPETRSSENFRQMQSFHRRYDERAPGRGDPLVAWRHAFLRRQPARAALRLLTGDASAALALRLERSPRQPVAMPGQPLSPPAADTRARPPAGFRWPSPDHPEGFADRVAGKRRTQDSLVSRVASPGLGNPRASLFETR